MRIGVNANYFQKPATGIGVVTLEFMRSLAERPEARAHEWIWYYEGGVPQGKWPREWRFERVKCWWKRDDILHRYLWERSALPQAVKQDQCDAFFSLYQSATIINQQPTIHDQQRGTIRHVMLVHDLIPKHFPEYLQNFRQRWHYQSVMRGIQNATHILVPSQSTANDIRQLFGRTAPPITVAAEGVPTLFRSSVSERDCQAILTRHQLTPGYLYHGGGLEVRKNTAVVLQAYAQLIQKAGPTPIPPLVISGTLYAEDNPLATPVRRLITELNLSEHVRLLGWVAETDLPALYQGAALFLYPSRYEGFGLPVLEAFAMGTPVITTPAGSLAELAADAALMISPTDSVAALANAMQTLLSDTALRSKLSAAGKVRAAEYQWSTFTGSVLKNLLS